MFAVGFGNIKMSSLTKITGSNSNIFLASAKDAASGLAELQKHFDVLTGTIVSSISQTVEATRLDCGLTHSGKKNYFICGDGTSCELNPPYDCCKFRGGRARCPSNLPHMCAKTKKFCGDDHCCELDCSGKYGGKLPICGW